MDTRKKRLAIGLATSFTLAAAFLLYFLVFHSPVLGRDSVLSLMPGSAETVFFVDLHDLRQAPFFADLIAWAPKPMVDNAYDEFRRDTGFDYEKDLDRIAVAFEKNATQQVFFAVANGRFDRKKIEDYAAKSGTAQKQPGSEIFSFPVTGRPERISLVFLRKDLIAFTNGPSLPSFLNPPKTPERAGWRAHFERLAGSPLFAVLRQDGIAEVIGTPPGSENLAQRATGGLTSPQLSSLLAQLQWLSIAGKPENDRLRIVTEAESSEDKNARQLADLLNGVVLLARVGLGSPRNLQQLDTGARTAYLDLLKSVEVSRIDRGETKSVRLMFDVTPQLLKSAPSPVPVTAPVTK